MHKGRLVFFSGYGLHVDIRIPQMRGAISRQLQGAKFLMSRPISVNGFCTAYLSRKSPRYRGMPSLHALKTLSYRYQRQHCQKYHSQRQRKQRLANLCRPCSSINQYCSQALSKRRLRVRVERYSLCTRFYNNRFMPLIVSLGTFSKTQRCRQDAHLIRSTREHTLYDLDHRRESSRCQHPGRIDSRTGFVLYYGSCLYRFLSAILSPSMFSILCNYGKEEFSNSNEIYSRKVDKSTGLRCDQTIRLTGTKSFQYYPEKLRRISYVDKETLNRYVFLTNNFVLSALVIAILYKCRWNIELFSNGLNNIYESKVLW